ncbi:hypothetical protein N9W06_00445 [Candidatus Marinimicrobia bacterium]|nr:hypothetical protein [Candidatus Neomarinimicrobiota bacterium]
MKLFILIIITNFIWAQSSKESTITVYKDGTALVKQEIIWDTVSKGKTNLRYGDIPKSIHKDTPFISIKNAQVLSQKLVEKTFSSDEYFSSKKGDIITIKLKNEKAVSGILLELTNKILTIQIKNSLRRFNRNNIEYIETGDIVSNPNFSPYLDWEVKNNKAGNLKANLVYKLSNISWNAIYRLTTNGQTKGELVVEGVISNNSSKNYINTNVNLVEGKINKVKSINNNNYGKIEMSRSLPNKNTPDALGDYHIYSAGKIKNFTAKENLTVGIYGPLNVNYEKNYVFENFERQQKEEPLKVEYTLSNTEKDGLGIVLPAGKVDIYTSSSKGGFEYIGSDRLGQVPKGESSTIQAGYAFDITGKRRVLNYDRQRKSEEAVIEVSINNTWSETASVKIIEHVNGDWVIKDQSHDYIKKDASTIYFLIDVKPGKKEFITYTYRKEWK